ncbi:hypothetical protein [Aquitalea pelogenes]|uniref:hypothetical protein n=1 Tax=Aquitalea pelogenes TaxID=1293573 RepID=UPI0035B3A215
MKRMKAVSLALLMALVTTTAWSADSSVKATPTGLQVQMQQLQAAHDKMMAAKTPEERQQAMTEQMKAMQSGMAMMQVMDKDMMANGKMPCQNMDAGKVDIKTMVNQRMKMMDIMQQMMGQQGGMMPMQ